MAHDLVCTECGHIGGTKTVTKGRFALEVILWLCFLVPGLIYSIWRLTTRHEACPVCGNSRLLPRSSPMAQKFLRDNMPDLAGQATQQAGAAHGAGRAVGRLVGRALK